MHNTVGQRAPRKRRCWGRNKGNGLRCKNFVRKWGWPYCRQHTARPLTLLMATLALFGTVLAISSDLLTWWDRLNGLSLQEELDEYKKHDDVVRLTADFDMGWALVWTDGETAYYADVTTNEQSGWHIPWGRIEVSCIDGDGIHFIIPEIFNVKQSSGFRHEEIVVPSTVMRSADSFWSVEGLSVYGQTLASLRGGYVTILGASTTELTQRELEQIR